MTHRSTPDRATVLIKGYSVTAKIGESTASVTHRACREADGLEVAVKMLYTDYTRIADVTRFKHAYGIIKHIDSERVVKVHGVEEHGDGLLLITEYFPGTPLSTALKRQGKLGVGAFLDTATAVTEALTDIHQRGCIHGDVRPQNILLGEGGRVKLTGFGVDSLVTREKEEIYSRRVLLEVLPYTSPEQTGRMNRSVDYRTDLYSLGVVLYEMLVGRRPFEAIDPLELMHAHIAVKPIPPSELDPEIPDALSAITMKLLSKNAEDRYHSAEGLKADLEECRRQWESTGRIRPFRPGQYDRNDLFQIPQKLYGREGDIQKLIASFDEALQGKRAIVLVSGYSGIGKSSLVQEILKPLAREKGYYISGKYDQYNRDTPYSAVVQAFDALIKQLLSESEERITKWRGAILSALGSNGQVICDVLPSLKHIIGEQPSVPALGPVEAQNRFNLYFQHFVSVFARHAHPLALFLDDLQWMDSASLSLITTLLAEDGQELLFFCGAYRDNEVDPTHPFIVALEELEKGGVGVVSIVLEPLRLVHLIELIDDSLKTSDGGAIANAVLKKTGGNPFFVKQFMRHLHEAKLLAFDPKAGWGWDLPQIERLEHTDNVLSLMAETIRRLPGATQEVLRLASAIGNSFELDVLDTVSERPLDETYGSLDNALGEGLIVSAGEQYRFAHDKIQEAAYSLIPAADRPAFHYRIGRLLLGKLDPDAGHNLFDIVNHLNSAGDLIEAPEERMALARQNLVAAGRAEESAAFNAALKYLEHGLSMLPEDAWTSHYELTFTYHTKKGLMASLCGRHDDALATLAGCFDEARGRLHKTEVRRLKMSVQNLKNDLPAALEEGLAALREYDIHLPPYPDDSELAAELDRTMAMIGDRPIASLVDLPPLEDPEIAALQDVLQEMFSPTYQLGTNNFGITVMKVLQNSLKYGISKSSIYAYVNFGTLLCSRFDIERGFEFGKAALRLNELHPDKKSEAMLWNMWGAWVQHWKESYTVIRATLRRSVHAGLETGQYIWSFYSTCNMMMSSLVMGRHLHDIIEEARLYQPLCRLDKFNAITWMVGAAAELCEELRAPDTGDGPPRTPWVDMAAVAAEAQQINNQGSLYFLNIFAVMSGIFRGAYEEVAEIWGRTDPATLGMLSAFHPTPCYYFYGGLAFSRASETAAPALREAYLAKLRECARKVEFWAEIGPQSSRHRSLILEAELARVERREGAGYLYDQGIAAAQEGQFLHDGALANELCARHYLDQGRTFLARAYMTEAHRLYARWGAARAMQRLERDFPHALQPEARSRQAALARSGYAGARGAVEHITDDDHAAAGLDGSADIESPALGSELDFVTVLKASQAVSGELVLDRLIETLLSIAVEHAGAERGLLICPRGEEYDIEAEVVTARDRVEVTHQQAKVTPSDLPLAVLHYVIRTQESVILDDAAAPNLFSDDIYVRARRPRSVLCVALVKQRALVGVLYLENNLTPRVFTEGRIAMLELLASQSAISLENARLYTQLQRENGERKQAEERQKLLLNELNHRVKNTLVLVQAIAGQTLRLAQSPRDFTEAFGARLLALSQTHNLLNESSWKGASLRDIVGIELLPHGSGDAGRFSLTGEDVRLRPEAAVMVGMVVHELATNATKYGALSLPSGHVQVTWSINGGTAGGSIHLEWLEMRGPPVEAPRRKGFGSRLIERDLGRQLASEVRLEFLPGGVRCVMRLPLSRVALP